MNVCAIRDEDGQIVAYQGFIADITEQKRANENSKRLEWMLSGKPISNMEVPTEAHDQGYGDLTQLNRDGVILKSLGRERLEDFANDYLELLGTSSAIYEANGDYAFGLFTSGWCRMMDCASRQLCEAADNAEALNSGQWLCHESCWTDCSQRAIAQGAPVDIACNGGLRIYAVPIFAGENVVGAINFGYGDPPRDPEKLRELANAYHLDCDALVREANAYDSRPPFIVELAKKRLHATARIIGSMIETKQAEEALRKSEETLRATLHSIGDAVIATDRKGRVAAMNPVAESLTGWSEGEATGQPLETVFRIVHEQTRQPVESPVTNVLKSDCIVGLANHTLLIARDGREIPIADSGAPIRNDAGEITGVVLVFRDQTKERAAWEALQSNYALLQIAGETAAFGGWSVDLERNICTWSDAVADTHDMPHGYAPSAQEGISFYAPEWRERITDVFTACAERGIPYDEEMEIITQKGKRVWVRTVGKAVRDEKGSIIKVQGSFQDISKQKTAEKLLQDERQQLLSIFNGIEEAVYIADPVTYEVLFVNNFLEKRLDTDFLGRKCYEQFQGFNAPCEFCTNQIILQNSGNVYRWEYYNPHLNRHYLLFDRIIKWPDGRDVRFEMAIDITERKQAEESARQSEERYRLLADNALDVIWVMTMDARFTYINPAIETMFGFTPDEWIGTGLWEHCDEQHFAEMQALIEKEAAKGPEQPGVIFETQMLRRDGSTIAVEIHGRVIFDDQGAPVSLQGATRDISERKRHEERIEHLVRVLRAIRDVNQLITHENDRDELLRQACEILVSMRGYRSAWVALRDADGNLESVAESGIGDDFAVVRQAMQQGEWPECHRLAREQADGIVQMHRPDRNCKSCSLSHSHRDTLSLAGALRHGARDYGVLVVALPAGLADDAEEQSLFHELVGDVAYALYAMESAHRRHEEEAKFRSYVENAPYGIFTADREGHYMDVNPSACDITGYARDELLAMRILDLVSPEDRETGLHNFQTLLDHGRSAGEFGFVHKGGEIRRWHVLAVALSSERFLGFVQDVTERQRAEAEKEKLQSQLLQAQKMESVGRLAGGIAHDFNNMLAVILGHAEMALDRIYPGQPIFDDLQEVRKAAERSANLTRQLLTFARKQIIAPRIIDLNETVERMLKMLRRLIGEDIDLAWLPGKNLPPIKVDPSQIDQILANLCVNARDAIDDVGKIAIQTDVVSFDEAYCAVHTGYVPGDFVLLAVSDNGCGMDRETVSHLFEPFFTTKEQGKGTGLGLASVYGAVKQNHGFVNVYSEPGQGTTFKIYLPQHHTRSTLQADTATAKPTAGGSETILLVEDEPAILRLATMMLESLGYVVIAANTPGMAIRLAHEHSGPIHLLMTDVVMPEMNGRDLANNLLSIYPGIKRLFMSGYTADVIAHHGVLDKGVYFIQKPFSHRDLALKVREALGL
jgi:PAS domain S-box-containing protein